MRVKKFILLIMFVFLSTFFSNTCVKSSDRTLTEGQNFFIIKNDNSLWKWNHNSGEPVKVMDDVKSVSRNCILKNDNTLWELDKESQRYVKISDEVVSMESCFSHTLFIKTDKSLWGYGLNDVGLLGDTNEDNIESPVKIANNVKKVQSGLYHSVFLKTDGSVWTLGANFEGQLGVEKSISKSMKPNKIMENISDIFAGGSATFAIDSYGKLWRWGTNNSMKVGGNKDFLLYQPTEYISGVRAVQSHWGFNLVLKEDSTLWIYGETEEQRENPTEVHNLTSGIPIELSVKIMDDVNSLSDWVMFDYHKTLILKNTGELYYFDLIGNEENKSEIHLEKIMDNVRLMEYEKPMEPTLFSDISGLSEEKAINNLRKAGIITGTSEKDFSPNKVITRAEVAAILLRMQNLPVGENENSFSDVNKIDWFFDVAGASEKYNIVKGYEDNTFRANEPITKEQLVVLAVRVLQNEKKENSEKADILYSDKSSISEWAKESIEIAVSSGLIENSSTNFNPQNTVTRAEAATILYKLYNSI